MYCLQREQKAYVLHSVSVYPDNSWKFVVTHSKARPRERPFCVRKIKARILLAGSKGQFRLEETYRDLRVVFKMQGSLVCKCCVLQTFCFPVGGSTCSRGNMHHMTQVSSQMLFVGQVKYAVAEILES
jgi:hypothetical protein